MGSAASDFRDCAQTIEVSASDEILMRLQDMGRTEDIKFSPDCRRLAIAGFQKNRLLVLDINVVSSDNGISVSLTDFVEITSPSLYRPHGLAFMENDILIVANRRGEVPVFKIPSGNGGRKIHISASLTIGCNDEHKLETPGSVSAWNLGCDRYEILVCNNYANHVTRHILDSKDQLTLISSEKLLSNGLEVPDGLAVSNDNRWIAISNHDRNCVFLYENNDQLNAQSEPDGCLRDIIYPHGIRFTPDDNYVVVADAGSPYVNIYARNGGGWKGVHLPQATLRVMDEAAYWQGRINPQEGGPKGIDIDRDMNILVTTCEEKVLQFFDLRWMLGQRGVPFDKRIKYLWWRYGWRYERFKCRLQGLRA